MRTLRPYPMLQYIHMQNSVLAGGNAQRGAASTIGGVGPYHTVVSSRASEVASAALPKLKLNCL